MSVGETFRVKAESGMVSARMEEREEGLMGLMDLSLRNIVVRFCLTRGVRLSRSRLIQVVEYGEVCAGAECVLVWMGKSMC